MTLVVFVGLYLCLYSVVFLLYHFYYFHSIVSFSKLGIKFTFKKSPQYPPPT